VERPDGTLAPITKESEAAIDAKIERSFRSHREVPRGRNFLAWTMRWRDRLGAAYDQTFKGAPDTKGWWDSRFCPVCDMGICICNTGKATPKKRILVPRGSKIK